MDQLLDARSHAPGEFGHFRDGTGDATQTHVFEKEEGGEGQDGDVGPPVGFYCLAPTQELIRI